MHSLAHALTEKGITVDDWTDTPESRLFERE